MGDSGKVVFLGGGGGKRMMLKTQGLNDKLNTTFAMKICPSGDGCIGIVDLKVYSSEVVILCFLDIIQRETNPTCLAISLTGDLMYKATLLDSIICPAITFIVCTKESSYRK